MNCSGAAAGEHRLSVLDTRFGDQVVAGLGIRVRASTVGDPLAETCAVILGQVVNSNSTSGWDAIACSDSCGSSCSLGASPSAGEAEVGLQLVSPLLRAVLLEPGQHNRNTGAVQFTSLGLEIQQLTSGDASLWIELDSLAQSLHFDECESLLASDPILRAACGWVQPGNNASRAVMVSGGIFVIPDVLSSQALKLRAKVTTGVSKPGEAHGLNATISLQDLGTEDAAPLVASAVATTFVSGPIGGDSACNAVYGCLG